MVTVLIGLIEVVVLVGGGGDRQYGDKGEANNNSGFRVQDL